MGGLSLRELEASPRAALAVLFAFLHAAVAGEEAGVAQGLFERLVEADERAAQAHNDRAGLAGETTARGVDQHVHLATGVGDFERAEDRLAVALGREVVVELAV